MVPRPQRIRPACRRRKPGHSSASAASYLRLFAAKRAGITVQQRRISHCTPHARLFPDRVFERGAQVLRACSSRFLSRLWPILSGMAGPRDLDSVSFSRDQRCMARTERPGRDEEKFSSL
jgi:hypothetical protein